MPIRPTNLASSTNKNIWLLINNYTSIEIGKLYKIFTSVKMFLCLQKIYLILFKLEKNHKYILCGYLIVFIFILVTSCISLLYSGNWAFTPFLIDWLVCLDLNIYIIIIIVPPIIVQYNIICNIPLYIYDIPCLMSQNLSSKLFKIYFVR